MLCASLCFRRWRIVKLNRWKILHFWIYNVLAAPVLQSRDNLPYARGKKVWWETQPSNLVVCLAFILTFLFAISDKGKSLTLPEEMRSKRLGTSQVHDSSNICLKTYHARQKLGYEQRFKQRESVGNFASGKEIEEDGSKAYCCCRSETDSLC